MALSAQEIDREALQLVRRAIAKFTSDKKMWWKWDRSELLTDGFSTLVVAKAREYDALNEASSLWLMPGCVVLTHTPGRLGTLFSVLLISVGIGVWIYKKSQYNKTRLSEADNLLVLQELKEKLGPNHGERYDIPEEHPFLESLSRRLEKRALLWRLDAFLSRRPIST